MIFKEQKKMIEYKSKLLRIPISSIKPQDTSKTCDKYELIGIRNRKSFKCPSCGHVDHADVNATFNISKDIDRHCQSDADRDVSEGSNGPPKVALNH